MTDNSSMDHYSKKIYIHLWKIDIQQIKLFGKLAFIKNYYINPLPANHDNSRFNLFY